mmetsp:Transcript_14893/g.17405  ORF Transcript_14893/g.17405 Transcript_14893/m.17405 type:complete len:562 (+) Transcript_14893:268-1953(+)
MKAEPVAAVAVSGDVLLPKVEYSGRWDKAKKETCDLVCGMIFFVGTIVYFVLGFVAVSMKNFDPSAVSLDDILNNGTAFDAFSDDLVEELNECLNARRLQTVTIVEGDLFEAFGNDPYTVAVPILICGILGVLWLISLIKFSRAVAWGSTIISIILPAFIGIVLLVEGIPIATPALLIAYSAFLCFIAYRTREQIDAAAEHMKIAVTILMRKKSIFSVAAVIQLVFLLFMASSFWFLISSAFIYEVDVDCNLVLSNFSTKMMAYFAFWFFWVMHYCQASRLVVVAMTVGGFFFESADNPQNYALAGLKSTVTTSAPTLSVGSLITAVVEYVFRKIQERFWFLDPIGCLLQCVYLIFASVIIALTRFSLISHALSGEGFFASAKLSFNTVKQSGIAQNPNSSGGKAFLQGYITDRVAVFVTELSSNTFAVVCGVIGWALMDSATNQDTLSTLFEYIDNAFLFVMFVLGFLWVTKRPMFGLLGIILYLTWTPLPTPIELIPALAGLFAACLSALVLDFTAAIVLNAIDTVFMLEAISKINDFEYEGEKGEWARAMIGEPVTLH